MVAGAGGNVERDVIFRLKAEVDAKSFQTLSRFGKAATKIQAQIDKGVKRSAKTRATIEGKGAQATLRQLAKTLAAEKKARERSAKLVQKNIADQLKAVEKAAKAEEKVQAQAEKQLKKRRAAFVKNREKGLKAEQKAIKEATIQAEIFQKKGEAATKRFTAEIKKAAAGALLFARGLAFVGIASEEDLGKVVKAVLKVQGAFDILRGGERIIRSIIAAQKALAVATQVATAAQLTQNAAQASGAVAGVAGVAGGLGAPGAEAVGGVAVVGGISAARGLARGGAAAARGGRGVLGRAGRFAGAAAAAAPVAAAAAALVAGIALVNEDFRKGIGEFLGILESETDRLARVLRQKAALDRREIALRARTLDLASRERARESRAVSRQLQLQEARGELTPAQRTAKELARAREDLPAARERLEKAERGGTEAEILALEKNRNANLRAAQSLREEAQRIVKGVESERGSAGGRGIVRGALAGVESFGRLAGRTLGIIGPREQKRLDALEKIARLDKQILAFEKGSGKVLAQNAARIQEIQRATSELEAVKKRIQSGELQSIDQAKQRGEEVVRAAEKQIAAQLKVVESAKQLLKVRVNETRELEKQRKSQEKQFGLLTRREQRRKVRTIEALLAGRKVSLQRLRGAGQLFGEAGEEQQRQIAARAQAGVSQRPEIAEALGFGQKAIGAAREREEAARKLFKEGVEIVGKIELNFTIKEEEFKDAFNSVIEPGIKKIKAAAKEIVRMQMEEVARITGENNLNTPEQ